MEDTGKAASSHPGSESFKDRESSCNHSNKMVSGDQGGGNWLGISFKDGLVYKPPVAQKSSRVLAIAEEILRQKRRDAEGSLSDSEIYDDVITFRESDNEIYDDIITMMAANGNEIYDDVVTLIREMKAGGKPKVPSKPTWLLDLTAPTRRKVLKQRSYEDIYDDVVVERMREAPKPRHHRRLYGRQRMDELKLRGKEQGQPVHSNQATVMGLQCDHLQPTTAHNEIAPLSQDDHNHEAMYLNLQTMANQDSGVGREPGPHTSKQPSHNQQDGGHSPAQTEEKLYENECIHAGRVIQHEEDKAANAPKSLTMRRPRSISHDGTGQGVASRQSRTVHPQFTTGVKLQEVTSDSSNWQNTTTPPASVSSESRAKHDPLPEISEPRPHYLYLEHLRLQDSLDEDDNSDTYEDLPLYEDLGTYQEEGEPPYQNVTQAVVEALGLPEQMRTRVRRITAGERKKLRKSLKHVQQLKRSKSMPESALAPARKSTEEHQTQASEGKSENEKADDSGDDETIPFGKSRVVFEMLLDASGIERVPEDTLKRGNDLTQDLSSKSDSDIHALKHDHLHVNEHKSSPYFDSLELDKLYDTPEIKRYQAAGIIQRRTRSEIEEEIRQITASAPSQPPPLPGLNRSRLREITRSDKVIHKRVVLKRKQTVETCDQPLQDSTVHDSDRHTTLPPHHVHNSYDSIPEHTVPHQNSYDSIPEHPVPHQNSYDSIPEHPVPHQNSYDFIPEHTVPHQNSYDFIPEHTVPHHVAYDSIPDRVHS